MSGRLRDSYVTDLDETFFDEDEFACYREFEIIVSGAKTRFITRCVWDTEQLKTRLIVVQQGVYMGSVMCYIAKSWFAAEPEPEQVIYSRKCFVPEVTALAAAQGAVPNPQPIGIMEGWRVVDITDAEECYELALDRLVG